ncbi:MAG TPA: NADH-ubiquinone oxidoreductase-F iron-sulfur binding region domain-containing protein [Actinomycetota bacterium]|nr:NADH-ubiquinone oxidoreductase-F iron-sulfur binding region domain-containing protein [Actinomycetota bacterium]
MKAVTDRLLDTHESWSDYVTAGGGGGIERARTLGPDELIELVAASGLRGRGGAGFPTGTKWRSVATAGGEHFVICNAAEGEPATFKDRFLLRRNPYAVLEGVAIAALAVGAKRAYIGLKEAFTLETEYVVGAIEAMESDGVFDGLEVELVHGPDRYLFGEETGLVGVMDGRGPFPREVRPFMQGPFATSSRPNPSLVNNVETLANVPAIVALGPEWFRSTGTDSSPGTMLFTVAGDVRSEGVFELPLGTSLRELIEDRAGGAPDDRAIKAVLPGASNALIAGDRLDLALDFDVMRRAGTGLGAGGFAVYDESACMVEVTRQYSWFLHVESCAQCPACKLNSGSINEIVTALHAGSGSLGDVEEIVSRADRVTDGQKCALPTGTKLLVLSLIQGFAEEFAAHVSKKCPMDRTLPFPKLVDYDDEAGAFLYDRVYEQTSPQWTEQIGGAPRTES